jgi:hypothetical protein
LGTTRALLLLLLIGCSPTETFDLPAGFSGPVAIVYDDPTGQIEQPYTVSTDGLAFLRATTRRSRLVVRTSKGDSLRPVVEARVASNRCWKGRAPDFVFAVFRVGEASADPECLVWRARNQWLQHRGLGDAVECLEKGHFTKSCGE